MNLRVWLAIGALSVAVVGAAPAAVAAPQGADVAAPARAKNAKEQLKRADEARRAIHGKGEERREGATKAVVAYEAVLSAFPEAKSEGALASFRLGEIRRTLGQLAESRGAFLKVVALEADRKLAARAMLEVGHLDRRAKELGKALETYRKVATDFSDESATRDDALYWIGVLHETAKEPVKARESWQAVADRGADPLDRVRAFDRIAGSFLKEGKRDEAVKTLERARGALHDAAAEPSSAGSRVRKALERMTTARRLEKEASSAKKGTGGAADGEDADDDDSDDEEDDD